MFVVRDYKFWIETTGNTTIRNLELVEHPHFFEIDSDYDFVSEWEKANLIPFSTFENKQFIVTDEGYEMLDYNELERLHKILYSANLNVRQTLEYIEANPISRNGDRVMQYTAVETSEGLVIYGVGNDSRGPISTAVWIGATTIRFMITGSLASATTAAFTIAGWRLQKQPHISNPLRALGAVLGLAATVGLDIEITPPIRVIQDRVLNGLERLNTTRQWIRSVMPWEGNLYLTFEDFN